MGEPVRIVDLARDLIRLSGLRRRADIEIVFTGLRPGEKLYEELFFDQESAEPTEHAKILRSKMTAPSANLLREVDQLVAMAQAVAERDVVRRTLRRIVPDYVPPDLRVGEPEMVVPAAH